MFHFDAEQFPMPMSMQNLCGHKHFDDGTLEIHFSYIDNNYISMLAGKWQGHIFSRFKGPVERTRMCPKDCADNICIELSSFSQ